MTVIKTMPKMIRFIPFTTEIKEKLDCLIFYIEQKHKGFWAKTFVNDDTFFMKFSDGGNAKLILPHKNGDLVILITDNLTTQIVYGIIK